MLSIATSRCCTAISYPYLNPSPNPNPNPNPYPDPDPNPTPNPNQVLHRDSHEQAHGSHASVRRTYLQPQANMHPRQACYSRDVASPRTGPVVYGTS